MPYGEMELELEAPVGPVGGRMPQRFLDSTCSKAEGPIQLNDIWMDPQGRAMHKLH